MEQASGGRLVHIAFRGNAACAKRKRYIVLKFACKASFHGHIKL